MGLAVIAPTNSQSMRAKSLWRRLHIEVSASANRCSSIHTLFSRIMSASIALLVGASTIASAGFSQFQLIGRNIPILWAQDKGVSFPSQFKDEPRLMMVSSVGLKCIVDASH